MATLSIRPATHADLPVLRTMLHHAAFWRGEADAPSVEVALRDPGLAVYLDGWPRAGDVGLVARVDGMPAGAVWVRRFPADTRGYGYLDEDTPELSIAVAPRWRGRGIGASLLTSMLTTLRLGGVGRVSLSVERDNPARDLYLRLGFVVHRHADGDVLMVRALR